MIGDRNAGYEIIAEEYFFKNGDRAEGVALGRTVKAVGSNFVTWEFAEYKCEPRSYFWGHYYDSELRARINYHERVLDILKCILTSKTQ